MTKRKRISDRVLATAIMKHAGLLTKVADALGYTYRNVRKRIDNSETLQDIYKLTVETDLDIAEYHVKAAIRAGNLNVAWKYLRTKGKDRGYNFRQEVTGEDGGPVEVNININRTVVKSGK